MDKRIKIKTLVKKKSKFTNYYIGNYIRGFIRGIEYYITGIEPLDYFYTNKYGDILEAYFTDKEYEIFINKIEKIYPGLCIFNYEEKSK